MVTRAREEHRPVVEHRHSTGEVSSSITGMMYRMSLRRWETSGLNSLRTAESSAASREVARSTLWITLSATTGERRRSEAMAEAWVVHPKTNVANDSRAD
jgi:hypothetical protein